MREPKARQDSKIKNREHRTYRMKWARGTITIRAMVDKYPAGNFVTYTMSVSRRRKEIGHTKSGKPIFAKAEVIERNTYAMVHSDRMMARVEYFQSLPKEMEVTGEN